MSRFFKELYSSIEDTLDEDFIKMDAENVGANVGLKFISNISNDKGIKIKATGFRHPNGIKVEGVLAPQFDFKKLYLSLKSKLRTTERYSSTLSYSNFFGSTLSLTVKHEDDNQFIEPGINYLHKDYGSVNFNICVPLKSQFEWVDLKSAFVVNHSGFSLGSKLNLRYKDSNPIDFQEKYGYLQYDAEKLSVALFYKNINSKGSRVGLGGYQQFNDIRGAFEVALDPKNYLKPFIRTGCSCKLDNNSLLKLRLMQTGTEETRIGISFKQKLSDIAKVTLISDFNLWEIIDKTSSIGFGNQYGIKFTVFE